MSSICIKSDYCDFYDNLCDNKSNIVYNRYLSQGKQRGTALKYLRDLGIKTIEIKQVNTFIRTDGPIVVYTNPRGHHGEGKEIMSVDEALQYYGNYIASTYYEGITTTIKYLQIGKRRFTLQYKRDNSKSLSTGTLVKISESKSEYNRLIGIPIFSIDYLLYNDELLATDFNEVENLGLIGFTQYMSSEDIINEIKESLLIYNKI